MTKSSETERYPFSYLPPQVAAYFRDALGCYRNNLLLAFAAMCRMTAQALFEDLGEGAKLKIFDQVEEIAGLAGIDDRDGRIIRNILFDTDAQSLYLPQGLEKTTAAILLETMKDVLHQAYIRRAVLRQRLEMRKFFADPTLTDVDESGNVAPITQANRK